ncbi:Metallo-dependent phosphatase-like protein [Suillus fuscotomentosus]|uniref:Metallo-dependent phosphatase-like protein n=1 Tax=Suillus fuscotomentosus TaxID=1912939 RepID=A0AAD4EI74_9AGAM|nr:Metallo-dependent phosphatase-like protein [Suillus fuscotomentosus]KAG1906607.1 Metallo-dependent phosphatase-like protein [Suillus fuscotomentosus]
MTETVRIYRQGADIIPPHPGSDWTRFVCISDTHSHTFHIPAGDVLLHAGDLSSWGSLSQLIVTVEWLKSLDHPVKIMVAGNHDLCLDEMWAQPIYGLPPEEVQQARTYVRSQTAAGLHYIEHEPFRFMSSSGRQWKIYGSPAAPLYALGSFQYETPDEARVIYNRIPNDTDILMTHTPPFMTLDRTRKGKHAGCHVLSNKLAELHNCRLHVFGHIHECAGAQINTHDPFRLVDRVSVNAAMAVTKKAIVVDLLN